MIMTAQAVQPAPPVAPSMTLIERAPSIVPDSGVVISAIGSCLRHGAPIDLERLWLLQNREVAIDAPAGPLNVSVERDKLKIAAAAENGGQRVRIWEFGYMLADEGGKLDVQLSLGVLERELVLYWRETFQSRIYQQGLFRISGSELVPLCEGRGGITSSH